MKIQKPHNPIFVLVIIGFVLYAGIFIYQTSFVINGERYFSLFDDAMVSMRYAENVAHGYGPVWNPGGEKVEGYTNPLWMYYMSFFHLFPIPQSKISLIIQISGAFFLLLNLILVKNIAEFVSNHSNFSSLSAVILTALYLPINNWGLQGMEVSILILLLSICILETLKCARFGRFSTWLYVLLGVGTLIRMDMIVPFIVILVFLTSVDSKNRAKHIGFGVLILALFLGAQTIFRLWYYGDLLPNTYYLKMTEFPILYRIGRGIYVTLNFIQKMGWILFLAPFSLLLVRRDHPIFLLLLIFFAQIGYSIYVGGDAWEWWGGSNRYISIAMPIFFVLLGDVFGRAMTILETILNNARRAQHATIALLLATLVSLNMINSPESLATWLLVWPPLHVSDNKLKVETALFLKQTTTNDAKIAVDWAGAIPYFSERPSIDLLGKSDKKIARDLARIDYNQDIFYQVISFYPGHNKWNLNYSIGKLRPDIILSSFLSLDEAQIILDRDYKRLDWHGSVLYFRNDSVNVTPDKIPQ